MFKNRMCWPFHEFSPDFGEDEIEAVAKMGFNQVVINFDSWPGGSPALFKMTDSGVWPGMADPELLAWSSEWLDEKIEAILKQGMEPYIYVFEPVVPFEPVVKYVHPSPVRAEFRSQIEEECLGWRYADEGNEEFEKSTGYSGFFLRGRPLCISHAKVQEFYRSLGRELVSRYPGLKGMILCTWDGGHEFCDAHCPRCHVETVMDRMAYHARGMVTMLNCIHEGISEVKADFDILLDNHGLVDYTQEIMDTVSFPLGMLLKDTGIDCDMAPTEPSPLFRSLAGQCRSAGIKWYALGELASAEEYGLAMGYPDPLTIIRKVKAYLPEEVENISTYWGIPPQAQTINDRILAAVLQNPDESEDKLITEITNELFGEAACAHWIRAWHCIRSATEVWMRRRGYHSLRLNFFGARLKLVGMPVTFPLTCPDGTRDENWLWSVCFTRKVREANLEVMPELLCHLDFAISSIRQAMKAIPDGQIPSRQVYRQHEAWDSKRYGEEILYAVQYVRELVESEMHMYSVAQVRDIVEDSRLSAEEKKRIALDRLPRIFMEELKTMERLLPALERQLLFSRIPDMPGYKADRRFCDPSKWDIVSLIDNKIADIPAAMERAMLWVNENV